MAPSLPVIDLSPLSSPSPSPADLDRLSKELSAAFSTTGFAYLSHAPLSIPQSSIFNLARTLFSLPTSTKHSLAKRTFNRKNGNTYHGYFPPQPTLASDNLKEGFEMGPPSPVPPSPLTLTSPIDLTEPNVWPPASSPFNQQLRTQAETLHTELQALSQRLLSLLAVSLGKDSKYFNYMHTNSVSTLRFLHYPTPPSSTPSTSTSTSTSTTIPSKTKNEFACTPHTDSGILTLLTQDPTGGLEVLLPSRDEHGDGGGGGGGGEERWVSAPYIEDTLVVNIGDLMAEVSGGRWRATMHRVRSPQMEGGGEGRVSVPFFFEPGVECIVRSVDGGDAGGRGGGGVGGQGVVYGEHVLGKMKGWVEFADGRETGREGMGMVEGVKEVSVGA